MAAKIPQLLGQYLYKNRKMLLPGLGVFTIDKSVVLPEENDRSQNSVPNGVQFQNANIIAADKELISFICENTGKIKPLAISDLDSYLNLGTEMLNIGKPFYLEGIGTITRGKSGRFEFAAGDYMATKENISPGVRGRKFYGKDKKQVALPDNVPGSNGLKLLALIAALIIVCLGGWLIYKKNAPVPEATMQETTPVQPLPVVLQDSVASTPKDPVSDSKKTDTSKTTRIATATPAITNSPALSSFRFIILQTHDKDRAMRRYQQLSRFDANARISLQDTANFKVYFDLPALAKDTIHIKDSLRREYAHEVVVER